MKYFPFIAFYNLKIVQQFLLIFIYSRKHFICPLFNSAVHEFKQNRKPINSLPAGCRAPAGSPDPWASRALEVWALLNLSFCLELPLTHQTSLQDPTCLHPHPPTPQAHTMRGGPSRWVSLENHTGEVLEMDNLTTWLVPKALLDVVQSGGKNTEFAVIRWVISTLQDLKSWRHWEICCWNWKRKWKEETKESIMMSKILLVAIFKFKSWMILKMTRRHFQSIHPNGPNVLLWTPIDWGAGLETRAEAASGGGKMRGRRDTMARGKSKERRKEGDADMSCFRLSSSDSFIWAHLLFDNFEESCCFWNDFWGFLFDCLVSFIFVCGLDLFLKGCFLISFCCNDCKLSIHSKLSVFFQMKRIYFSLPFVFLWQWSFWQHWWVKDKAAMFAVPHLGKCLDGAGLWLSSSGPPYTAVNWLPGKRRPSLADWPWFPLSAYIK